MSDMVNHPPHYTCGRYEVIDVIQDALTTEEFHGYCMGNVLKYVMRHRMKGGTEDLEKARWYLDKAISEDHEKTEDADKSHDEAFTDALLRSLDGWRAGGR